MGNDFALNDISFTQIGGMGLHTFAYDYRSRRYYRSTPTTPHMYCVFDGGLSIQEYETTTINEQLSTINLQTEFVRGEGMGGGVGGMVYSIKADSSEPTADSIIFSHANHRGDVIGRSDENRSLTSFALYEAYGTRPYEWGDDPDRHKANTKEEESDLGLLNEGMRFRDLETGVFLTRDPIGYGDGPNVYCYVHCNPITAFDPLGLEIVLSDAILNSDQADAAQETLNQAIDYLMQSSTAAEIITELQNADEVYVVDFVTEMKEGTDGEDVTGFNSYVANASDGFEPTKDNVMDSESDGGTISWDPNSGTVMPDGVQSPAMQLMHEFGHAQQDKNGAGASFSAATLEKINTELLESTIASELGEPVRDNYYDATGAQSMGTTTFYKHDKERTQTERNEQIKEREERQERYEGNEDEEEQDEENN